MNTALRSTRLVAVVLAAGATGAALGFASSAVAATRMPVFDPARSACVVAPQPEDIGLGMPPSDFLRGAGRTAPIPH